MLALQLAWHQAVIPGRWENRPIASHEPEMEGLGGIKCCDILEVQGNRSDRPVLRGWDLEVDVLLGLSVIDNMDTSVVFCVVTVVGKVLVGSSVVSIVGCLAPPSGLMSPCLVGKGYIFKNQYSLPGHNSLQSTRSHLTRYISLKKIITLIS